MSALLSVRDLKVHFPVRGGLPFVARDVIKAVDGISIEVSRGEVLGIVGESGSGKSTLAQALLRLVPATAGEVDFDGHDVLRLRPRALRELRKRIAMVFQDPYASLNPRLTVGRSISEPLEIHGLREGRRARRARVEELLGLVGLDAEYRYRFPHELSGGQRQRVGIARALATEPDCLICDEAIASLDVSMQAQIMNLLLELRTELGLAQIFIAHDLAAVQHMSDRIAVMYRGKVVETGAAEEIAGAPKHPYTQALLSAVPIPDPDRERARQRVVFDAAG